MIDHQSQELKPNVYAALCPSREVLTLIGEKWVSLVIGALEGKIMRFGELKRVCEGISQKMLTKVLRAFERDGLVARHDTGGFPRVVRYELTALGHGLLGPVDTMSVWANENLGKIQSHRAAYDQRET